MLVKKVIILSIFTLLVGCIGWGSEEEFPDLDSYKRVSIEISETNYEKLYKTSLVNEWVSGHVSIGGNRYVELRQQGNAARKHPKISLKARLGEKSTILSAQFVDKSFSRYFLTNYLFEKAGFVTPEIEPVVLFVNNAYVGLYLQREVIDEDFFNSNNLNVGSVYKANFGARFTFASNMAVNAGFNKKMPYDNESYYDLEELILKIDNFPQTITSEVLNRSIDLKNVLDYIAVSELTNNFDCITYNFYLMYNKDIKKFQFIPWDLDRTFGGLKDDLPNYSNGLFEKLLTIEENAAYVKKRQKDLFDPEELKDVLRTYQNKIRLAYEADPYLSYRSMESHEAEIGTFIDSVYSYLYR